MVEGMFSTSLIQAKEGNTRLVFNPVRMKDLRTGAMCLDEVIKSHVQRIEDEERAGRQEIANGKAAKTKVRPGARRHCITSIALPGHERSSR